VSDTDSRWVSLRGARWSLAAGVVAVASGFYMLTTTASTSEPILAVLARGLGGLGIAAGVWMLVATARRSDLLDLLERIAYVLEEDEAPDDPPEG
jgi:hypothetical protein